MACSSVCSPRGEGFPAARRRRRGVIATVTRWLAQAATGPTLQPLLVHGLGIASAPSAGHRQDRPLVASLGHGRCPA